MANTALKAVPKERDDALEKTLPLEPGSVPSEREIKRPRRRVHGWVATLTFPQRSIRNIAKRWRRSRRRSANSITP